MPDERGQMLSKLPPCAGKNQSAWSWHALDHRFEDNRPTMTQKQKRKNIDPSRWRKILQQERGTMISRQPVTFVRIQSALSPRITAAYQKQNKKDVDRSE